MAKAHRLLLLLLLLSLSLSPSLSSPLKAASVKASISAVDAEIDATVVKVGRLKRARKELVAVGKNKKMMKEEGGLFSAEAVEKTLADILAGVMVDTSTPLQQPQLSAPPSAPSAPSAGAAADPSSDLLTAAPFRHPSSAPPARPGQHFSASFDDFFIPKGIISPPAGVTAYALLAFKPKDRGGMGSRKKQRGSNASLQDAGRVLNVAAVATKDKKVHFYEADGTFISSYDATHVVTRIAFESSEAPVLVTGGADGTLLFHNVTLWKNGAVLVGKKDKVSPRKTQKGERGLGWNDPPELC